MNYDEQIWFVEILTYKIDEYKKSHIEKYIENWLPGRIKLNDANFSLDAVLLSACILSFFKYALQIIWENEYIPTDYCS